MFTQVTLTQHYGVDMKFLSVSTECSADVNIHFHKCYNLEFHKKYKDFAVKVTQWPCL